MAQLLVVKQAGVPFELKPVCVEGQDATSGYTVKLPFEQVRHLVVGTVPPKRPNRIGPVHQVDLTIPREEFEAWEQASDEALENFEKGLEE